MDNLLCEAAPLESRVKNKDLKMGEIHSPLTLCDVSVAACDAGHWGADCVETCDCRNGDGSCDAVTGQCNCEAGYTGTQCHQSTWLMLLYCLHNFLGHSVLILKALYAKLFVLLKHLSSFLCK